MISGVGGEAVDAERGESPVADAVGVVALVMYSVTASIAFAALVFTGAAADGLPRGASTFLFASGLITVALGLRTRFPLAFGVVQDTAAIVFVPAVAAIVASGSEDPVRDVFVALSLSALITGAVLWVIGSSGLAGAARFMPTTVVAGFLAGTGWLLAKGGVDVMTDRSLGVGDLDDLFRWDLARFWLPGVALGLLIALVPLVRRLPPLVSSVATVASTIAFFAVVAVVSSIDAVEAGGWLIGPFAESDGIAPVFGDLADADWSAVGSATGQIGVVVLLSLLGCLLNISGIQTLLKHRADLDAELRVVGVANVLIAPVGGLVGYHGLGDSALADRLGVRRRWAPIAVGVGTGAFAFVGAGLIGLLPKFVAGGLLVGAGLGLLLDWVRELRATTSISDRLVSVVILAVICFVGILEGIVVGVVAACVFFVIRYSRIDAIRLVSTGADVHSVVQRSATAAKQLQEVADRLVVYELHGSLFFGSVVGVAAKVRDRLAGTDAPAVIVIDFARVSDIDSSAFAELDDIHDQVVAAGSTMVWSALPEGAEVVLERRGVDPLCTPDLDAALEIAEDRLLASLPAEDPATAPAPAYPTELLEHFDVRTYAAGEVIMTEGQESGELVVVTSGAVRVSHRGADGSDVRLRTLQAEVTLGEIGFLTGERRTATITAETDVELRALDAAGLDRLREENPALLVGLYERVLRTAADRAASIHDSFTQARR